MLIALLMTRGLQIPVNEIVDLPKSREYQMIFSFRSPKGRGLKYSEKARSRLRT